MPNLLIVISADDPSDLEYIRHHAHGAVVDVVEEAKDEGRFDSEVEVSWEIEDDPPTHTN